MLMGVEGEFKMEGMGLVLGCFRVLGVGVVFFVIWFVVDVFKLIIGVAVSMTV